MIKGKLYQGYNIKGELVYKFRNLEEFDRYFNHVGDILATSLDGNFIKTKECFFYYEEATDVKIDKLISQLYIDKKLTGPILLDRLNYIKRLGYQITTDIMEQLNRGKDNFSYVVNVNPKEYMEKEKISKEDPLRSVIMGGPSSRKLDTIIFEEASKPTSELGGEDGGNYDKAGNSQHYQKQFIEFIYDIELSFGTVIAALVCESNVLKYNNRVKEGVPFSKDKAKAQWYTNVAKHFREKAAKHQQGEKIEFGNKFINISGPVRKLLQCDNEIFDKNSYISLEEINKKYDQNK